jgi:hypothetical protein
MIHDPLFDLQFFLAVSKHRSYREHIRAKAHVFLRFLEEHHLLARRLRSRPDELPADLYITIADLTEEGQKLMEDAYDRWLDSVDRTDRPVTTRVLDTALKKLRDGQTG